MADNRKQEITKKQIRAEVIAKRDALSEIQRKAAAEQEAHAPKKRHSVSSSFISGNLQQDVFNHHH